LCDWRTVGKWLQPFEPQFVCLAACEAGRSQAVRGLFESTKPTLRDVYASPVALYATQAAALAVLIALRLWFDDIGDKHSLALRVVNYIGTGGQLSHGVQRPVRLGNLW
jgi:predicted aminopeptidase